LDRKETKIIGLIWLIILLAKPGSTSDSCKKTGIPKNQPPIAAGREP